MPVHVQQRCVRARERTGVGADEWMIDRGRRAAVDWLQRMRGHGALQLCRVTLHACGGVRQGGRT